MNLQQLGKEYVEQSARVFAQAQGVRSKCSGTRGLELFRLQTESVRLEEIGRDLRITGESLIHYYDEQ